MPELAAHFRYETHVVNGVTHRVAGTSKEQPGVTDGAALGATMRTLFMDGITAEKRKRELAEAERQRSSTGLTESAVNALRAENASLRAEVARLRALASSSQPHDK